MYVSLDRDRCSGIGICESIAPGYFEIAEDGSLQLLRDDVEPEAITEVEEAVRSCPTLALTLQR
ncbi:MAG: ferredoxin [Pseudonocardiales bacterium]|nr:ferredoxin [Pseudonocardiales bacterium]